MKLHVAHVLPAGTADIEPARAFLQDRIGLWAFWVFILSFGFYLTNLLSSPFVRRASGSIADTILQAGNVDHLAASRPADAWRCVM